MTEAATIDRPSVAKAAVSRRRSAKPASVSASALALHLDCSRTYIGKLEVEGVMGRGGIPRRVRDHNREGAQTAAAMRGGARYDGISNLQTLIFIAAMVVAVIAVRSISIFPSGNASR
jgi:hypothetical protein